MTRDSTAALRRSNGPVDEALKDVRKSFERFCLAAGIEVLGTMITSVADRPSDSASRRNRRPRAEFSAAQE